MANQLFDHARELFLTGALDWTSSTIYAAMIDTSLYTKDVSGHSYLSDVSGSAIISTSPAFTNKGAAGGAASADSVTFSSVSHANPLGGIIIYAYISAPETSPLIAWIDTATGLPITPNGGDIIVNWDPGPNKIFRL